MKKYLSLTVLLFSLGLAFPAYSLAQGMMGFSSATASTTAIQSQQQEEQEGKQFLDNLNNKTVICSQLTNADFEKIGEYFMGQAIGNTARHIAMNNMMTGMMGVQGEEQMHIIWGKRGSGCDTSAAFPNGSGTWLPMMQMMMGGGSPLSGLNQGNNFMMGNFGGWSMMGGYGGFMMLGSWLLYILVIAALVLLIVWLIKQIRK